MSKIDIGGREFEVSDAERDRYLQAKQSFKAAQGRASALGELGNLKKRMQREIASYRLNIEQMRQGASSDLLQAIAADVAEMADEIKALNEARRA